jgi:DNA repair protein RecO (recombination protein O)
MWQEKLRHYRIREWMINFESGRSSAIMRDYKAEGIIIRVRDYNEADRLVTIFTREHGKIQAIAKGCRKPKSRKRGLMQLFTHANFVLYRGRTLDTITQCEGIDSFGSLREDLDRMANAAYIAELLDGFVNSAEPHQELYFLSLVCLNLLTAEDPALVTRVFEMRSMSLLGYRPQLDSCVYCGVVIIRKRIVFSPLMGGVLCEKCTHHDYSNISCSMGTVNMLKQLMNWDLRRIRVLKMSPETKKEIGVILNSYISQRLDKKIKSAEFLLSLESMKHNG